VNASEAASYQTCPNNSQCVEADHSGGVFPRGFVSHQFGLVAKASEFNSMLKQPKSKLRKAKVTPDKCNRNVNCELQKAISG
jgi:hypothetical protein